MEELAQDLAMLEEQSKVDRRDRFATFTKTSGFKEFIDDGYFEEEAMRLPHALTNHSMQDEIDQRAIVEMIRSIGHLKNFLDQIIIDGNTSQRKIEEKKEEELQMQLYADSTMEVDPITGDEYLVEDK